MSKKKVGIIIGVIAVVAVAVVGGLYFTGGLKGTTGSSDDKVYVESVATLTQQYTGAGNRYSGVIEPQNSLEVNKDADRTVSEVLVKEGDEVSEGTELFRYDVEEMSLQIEQQRLELENIDNEIAGYNAQIAELQTEKASVPADQQFEYTTQIQTAQAQIKQAEFNKKSKQAEMEKTQASIENSTVTSKIAGVVKTIDEDGMDEYGNSVAYMTILATGDYQVKGTINEQNINTIYADQPVLIRSRVDESLTWSGTITKIDTENAISNNSDMYYSGSSDDTSTSSKYPFYVALDSMDGLILGQHVYIELDMGQTEIKEGMWLYSYYIVTDDGDPYVWADNGKNKLEKRTIELGEYDEELDQYEILSGLTEEDLIAWPMQGLYEGVTTVTNSEEVDYNAPLYQQESSEMMDGDMMYDEDMMYDTEYIMDEDMMYDTEYPIMDEGAYMDEGAVMDEGGAIDARSVEVSE